MDFFIDHQSNEQSRWVVSSVVLVFAFAGVLVTAGASRAGTDECIPKPNAATPQGSHWYYRTDRASQRQCWHLGENAKARTSEHQAATHVPIPSPKPLLQPVPEERDEVALLEPAFSGATEKNQRVAVASIEWQSVPSAVSDNDRALPKSADAHSTVTSADDLSVKSPMPGPTNQPAFVEAPHLAFGLGALFAVLGVALSIAAFVYRILRRTASRSKFRESHASPSAPANIVDPAPPNFGPVVATSSQVDPVQNRVIEQSVEENVEATVRSLLQQLQGRYRELHGHDFRPSSELSDQPGYRP